MKKVFRYFSYIKKSENGTLAELTWSRIRISHVKIIQCDYNHLFFISELSFELTQFDTAELPLNKVSFLMEMVWDNLCF